LKKFIQEDFKGENELLKLKKEVGILKEQIESTMEKKEKTIDIDFAMNKDQLLDCQVKTPKVRL